MNHYTRRRLAGLLSPCIVNLLQTASKSGSTHVILTLISFLKRYCWIRRDTPACGLNRRIVGVTGRISFIFHSEMGLKPGFGMGLK